MNKLYALALCLLAVPALLGLGVILLHVQGYTVLSNLHIVVIACAVAVILLLIGFFLGTSYRNAETRKLVDRSTFEKLKKALNVERTQRKKISNQRHQLGKRIIALENKLAEHYPAGSSQETRQKTNQMNKELETLSVTCEKLRSELSSRKERMTDLQAELFLAQSDVDRARQQIIELKKYSASNSSPPRLHGETLTEILDELVDQDHIHVALVADDQGLVVDAAGQTLEPDALAAVSGIVAELSPRVTDLLPIDEIATVTFGDTKGDTMEVRYFSLFGARCALALIGKEGKISSTMASNAIQLIQEKLAD